MKMMDISTQMFTLFNLDTRDIHDMGKDVREINKLKTDSERHNLTIKYITINFQQSIFWTIFMDNLNSLFLNEDFR